MAATTRTKVAALLEEDPTVPAIEIAARVGVSRARVYQILKDMGLSDRRKITRDLQRAAWKAYRDRGFRYREEKA